MNDMNRRQRRAAGCGVGTPMRPLPSWAPPGTRLVELHKIEKTVKCDRCRRTCRNPRGESGWNVTMRDGIGVGFLCPGCQTPEESAEAEINAATTIYGSNADGRVTAGPKF